jgi:hypothetical protein
LSRQCLVALLLVAFAGDLSAQRTDSTRAAAPARSARRPVRDSLAPPISPRRAFIYSALVPGLGQTVLDRGRAGGLFFLAETIGAAMAVKSAYDLRYARAHSRDSIPSGYQVDAATGLPKLDSLGRLIPTEFERNRYAGTRVRARRTHLEDWYAFLIFNHLFAGAEAFVSAHLWDFPARVGIRQGPQNGVDLVVTVPW